MKVLRNRGRSLRDVVYLGNRGEPLDRDERVFTAERLDFHRPRVAAAHDGVTVAHAADRPKAFHKGDWPVVVAIRKTATGHRNTWRRLPRERWGPVKQRPPATLCQ